VLVVKPKGMTRRLPLCLFEHRPPPLCHCESPRSTSSIPAKPPYCHFESRRTTPSVISNSGNAGVRNLITSEHYRPVHTNHQHPAHCSSIRPARPAHAKDFSSRALHRNGRLMRLFPFLIAHADATHPLPFRTPAQPG
jgi:hypothetical protein